MKDIVNSFKAHLYERTSSPLIGAFIFYWLIFNYKMIVILFDDKLESNVKFSNIDKIYQNDIFYNIPLNGVIYPIIATLLYLLVFPWISNLIFEGWTYHQNNLKRIGNKKVLTYKEYGELQRKFTELELSFDETFSKKDREINQLKSLNTEKEKLNFEIQEQLEKSKKRIEYLNELEESSKKILERSDAQEKQISELQNKLKTLIPKEYLGYDEVEINILKYIGSNNSNQINTIVQALGFHRVKIESALEKLLSKNLISENVSSSNNRFYSITKEGREFLLENKLI